MTNSRQKTMLPILERYETKFLIPEDMIDPLSEFVSIYCSLDRYSKRSESKFYRINNLYFDSPNYLFLKKRIEGSDNRFNMRIRSYEDRSGADCFLEIKQKQVDIIRKYRALSYQEECRELFQTPGYKLKKGRNNRETSNKRLFLRLAHTYNATPKILTQYLRKAYVSDIDYYARVTFDKDLRSMPEDGYSLVPDEAQMVPFDNETLFDPGCSIILEIKCLCTNIPLWIIDMIRYFDLQKRRFSKYVSGVSQVLGLYRYDSGNRQAMLNSKMYPFSLTGY